MILFFFFFQFVLCTLEVVDDFQSNDGRAILVQLSLVNENCEMCIETKKKWDTLVQEFHKNKEVFVSRLECDARDEALCMRIYEDIPTIFGYPSVIYGSPYALGVWYGNRDLNSLRNLASRLRAPCSPIRPDRCNRKQLHQIESMNALSVDDLDEIIVTATKKYENDYAEILRAIQNKREQILQRLEAYQLIADQDTQKLQQELNLARAVAKSVSGASYLFPSQLEEENDFTIHDTYSDSDLLAPLYDDYLYGDEEYHVYDEYDQDLHLFPNRNRFGDDYDYEDIDATEYYYDFYSSENYAQSADYDNTYYYYGTPVAGTSSYAGTVNDGDAMPSAWQRRRNAEST
uniref:Thioredoxin domain-containing protein n=1 Tax=Aureoumbra lagunensis TaxID=44058 RepID=A0A7S3JSH9_9STRA